MSSTKLGVGLIFKMIRYMQLHVFESNLEIIVLVIVKLVRGKAEYDFYFCVYNYTQNWTRMRVIAY